MAQNMFSADNIMKEIHISNMRVFHTANINRVFIFSRGARHLLWNRGVFLEFFLKNNHRGSRFRCRCR